MCSLTSLTLKFGIRFLSVLLWRFDLLCPFGIGVVLWLSLATLMKDSFTLDLLALSVKVCLAISFNLKWLCFGYASGDALVNSVAKDITGFELCNVDTNPCFGWRRDGLSCQTNFEGYFTLTNFTDCLPLGERIWFRVPVIKFCLVSAS
jgi:hypothetical protein